MLGNRLNLGVRLIILVVVLVVVFFAQKHKKTNSAVFIAENYQLVDGEELIGDRHLVNDIPAVNPDSTVNVVIEIPAGSRDKWEVDKTSGHIVWEKKKGIHRVVPYLGYPGNYGMVPQTLLAESDGGDGDPLDVIVLSASVPRGSVLKVHIVGSLKLIDNHEMDDKLLAVIPGDTFDEARSISQLENMFPGVLSIVQTWFVHYKGVGKLESPGFADKVDAWDLIDKARKSYQNSSEY